MSDIQIILDETNEIKITAEISGDSVSTKGIKTRLVIETDDGMDMTFNGNFDEKSKDVTFIIPILSSLLASGEYKSRVEIILADSRYFATMEGTVDAVMPTRVKTSVQNSIVYKEKPLAPVTIEVKKQEVVKEVKKEEIVDTPEVDSLEELKSLFTEMQDNIADSALELKLADGEFETKELNLDVKFLSESDEYGSFEGYAAVFGNIDETGDVITKGAFSRTINGKRPLLLFNHDMKTAPIGVITELAEDEFGLRMKGVFAQTDRGRELSELVRMGALDSFSIGYKTIQSQRDRKSGVRHLSEIKLFEISLVNLPANALATIRSIKSADPVADDDTSLVDELKSMMAQFH